MHPIVRAAYPADRAVVAQARRFVRDTLVGWGADDAVDDAVLLTSELATNAIVHAGTPFEVICRAAESSVQIEVVDGDPSRTLSAPGRGSGPHRIGGRGLIMPVMLAAAWGVSYSAGSKTVWFRLCTRLALDSAVRAPDRPQQGRLTFLTEAGDLLAGTFDETMLVALAAQIVVPRLAPWCAFYRADDLGTAELTHVWHADERRIAPLRDLLLKTPPPPSEADAAPWAGLNAPRAGRLGETAAGVVAVPLRARWRSLGVMVLGGPESGLFSQEIMWMVEDLGHRIAIGLDNARMYSRQQAVSQALQRSLLPYAVPEIPGVEHGVVYRAAGEGHDVGGDFYDVFEAAPGRWRFAIGDVCGTGPEAAAVTGLARHALRLLAGEGYGVADVVERLNQAIIDEGARARLLTLLHGEIVRGPDEGIRLTLVSAGHPPPLRLSPSGDVTTATGPQLLLGVAEDAAFEEEVVDLGRGDVLVCVTDGVTERRGASGLLDDDDGLARLLTGWTDLSAGAVAERLRQAVEAFAPEPISDDLAILVLRIV